MTARKIVVLACDHDGCDAFLTAGDFESLPQLRARAAKENGWRSIPSFRDGGHTDLCRFHA